MQIQEMNLSLQSETNNIPDKINTGYLTRISLHAD